MHLMDVMGCLQRKYYRKKKVFRICRPFFYLLKEFRENSLHAGNPVTSRQTVARILNVGRGGEEAILRKNPHFCSNAGALPFPSKKP
jgi:hypothetical protein